MRTNDTNFVKAINHSGGGVASFRKRRPIDSDKSVDIHQNCNTIFRSIHLSSTVDEHRCQRLLTKNVRKTFGDKIVSSLFPQRVNWTSVRRFMNDVTITTFWMLPFWVLLIGLRHITSLSINPSLPRKSHSFQYNHVITTERKNSFLVLPGCCLGSSNFRAVRKSLTLSDATIETTGDERNTISSTPSSQTLQSKYPRKNSFSSTRPFNQDIARTLFPPLFISHDQKQNHDTPTPIRRHRRPSPFQEPSSAQTAERMLRRMMENRYRSDGRTACPDARTFGLVAGAFRRLTIGNSKNDSVSWHEEPKLNPQQIYSQNDKNDLINNKISKVEMNPVDKLQELLQLQLQFCQWEGWPVEVEPDVKMFNRVLLQLALRNRTNDDGNSDALQAWKYLQLMRSSRPKNVHGSNDSMLCSPNANSYAFVIEALAGHRPHFPSSTARNQRENLQQPILQPIESLAEVLNLVLKDEQPPNVSLEWCLVESEKLLDTLRQKFERSIGNEMDDDRSEFIGALSRSYKCLLEGWGRYAVAGVVDDWSDSDVFGSKQKHGTKYHSLREDVRYGANNKLFIDMTPMQRKEYAIERACELLERLETLEMEEPTQTIKIPSSSYASIILALSISDDSTKLRQSEVVLNSMLSRYGLLSTNKSTCVLKSALSSSLLDVADVATAFSGCIAAYAKENDAPKGEKILNQMLDLYDDGRLGDAFAPEARAFGTCIAIWAKYNAANIVRAEKILSELERVAENEAAKNNSFKLCATPYNIVIQMIVKSCSNVRMRSHPSKRRRSSEGNFLEADGTNERILHAMHLLDHMEYDMKVSPDPYTYSILLHAWVQQSRPGNEKAADRAEELLRRRLHGASETESNSKRSSNSRKITEDDIWPNVKHYSLVLKAHAKTKSAGGARKALALLSEMERIYSNANIIEEGDGRYERKDAAKPDLVCYSIVIDAFVHSGLPEASDVALRLLRAVETKYKGGDKSMKPNTRVYTAVILSLVKSPYSRDGSKSGKNSRNSQKAWSILVQMKKSGVRPNSFTYNYIINCASQAPSHDEEGQRIAFDIAIRAFQELRKSSQSEDYTGTEEECHPDSFTYAFMLKACANLLPYGSLRTKVISQTFRECCRTGYLNDAVLHRLRKSVSAEEYYDMIDLPLPKYFDYQSEKEIKTHDLPESWSRSHRAPRDQSQRGGNGDSVWNNGVKINF